MLTDIYMICLDRWSRMCVEGLKGAIVGLLIHSFWYRLTFCKVPNAV